MASQREQTGQSVKIARTGTGMPSLTDEKGAMLRDLYALRGSEILDRILDLDRPRELVRKLPFEDFFWLVKKIGDQDCLPLLALASVDQWHYLLDLEIWRKDRLDLDHTLFWIENLQEVDCKRLVR